MQWYVSTHSIHLGLVTPMMCSGKAKIDLCVCVCVCGFFHFLYSIFILPSIHLSTLHPFPMESAPHLTCTPHNWLILHQPTKSFQFQDLLEKIETQLCLTSFLGSVCWLPKLCQPYMCFTELAPLSPPDATYLAWKLAFSTGDWPTLVSQVSHPIEITLIN